MPERPPLLKPIRASGANRIDPAAYGAQSADYEARRGSSAERGYGGRWRKARATVLAREPLCRPSQVLLGKDVAAEVVDHWYPHCGLSWLFWTPALWVPMSKAWHDAEKQEVERRGELALDSLARQLGVSVLAGLEPMRVWEWRAAFATRDGRSPGG